MITPIAAAIGAKVVTDPLLNIAGKILDTNPPISASDTAGFQKELIRSGTGRSGEIAIPIDHELLAACRPERQQDFGRAIQGKTVQVMDTKGQLFSGQVEKVWMDDNQLHMQINGQTYGINDLRAVYQNPTATFTPTTSTQGGAR
jgi:hypothetical protein